MKKFLLLLTAVLCGTAARAQWTSDPAVNTRVTAIGKEDYGREVKTTADGRTYIVSITPEGGKNLAWRLQIVDKDGRITFPEEGMVVSCERNKTWTVVNQNLLVDRDGNALVFVNDFRNSSGNTDLVSNTVYKIAPDGTMLWPETGIDLSGGATFELTAHISAVQTTDGGYVMAYQTVGDDDYNKTTVRVEKLNADGTAAWSKPLVLADANRNYSYPYLVDAGDNQVLMIYLAGSNLDVMARLLDFDGSSVWSEDTKLYQGGFDQIPVWTHLAVNPAPDGGAFVTWRDDRYYESQFSNYISYIKNDGTLGFPGGVNALKISYAEYSRMDPSVVYDEQEKCVYAVYRQFSQNMQSRCGIYMQKISLDGELLWGPEGKPVVAIQDEVTTGYATVQKAGGSDIAVFYQCRTLADGNVHSYVMKYDKDGNGLWDKPVNFATTVSEKNDLLSSPLIDDKYWVLNWEDYRDVDNLKTNCLYLQRVNTDGTLGVPGDVGIHRNTAYGDAGTVTVYDATGRMVMKSAAADALTKAGLKAGLYIVKDNASGNTYKTTMK